MQQNTFLQFMFVMLIHNSSEYENTGLIGTHMICDYSTSVHNYSPGDYSRVGIRRFCQLNF